MMEALATLTEDMKRMVNEQRLGHVATVCPDGTPNLSPKGTTLVWDDHTLIFADLRSPNTIRNLLTNPAIEINVIDPVLRKGYRFKGSATVVRKGERFEKAVRFYEDGTGLSNERIRAVVLVAVSRALPLTSPAYDTGRDESSIRRQWIEHYLNLWRRLTPGPDGHSGEGAPNDH
jgi:predicted pyridoxine 5'-phosphate oxidase superfamily flavin-nucleotide-binding protein